MTTFAEFVRTCTGLSPYDYQRRIGEEGLPEILEAPTGAGKTQAVVLAWLYRRRFHPDLAVQAATPRWLVICQPMRTLVEQTKISIERWLSKAEFPDGTRAPRLHIFMGGEPTGPDDWRLCAEDDAIIVGTQDLLISKTLNRGYASSRYLWPVEFGVLNNGCHWVFDEIQLMGAGLPTSRQLQAFRQKFPSLGTTSSTWMSATIDSGTLRTVDNPELGERIELSEADRQTETLRRRLQAPKVLKEFVVADPKKRHASIAAEVLRQHKNETLTLVVANTVDEVRAIHEAIRKAKPEAELMLLHSRFRREDRRVLVDRLAGPVGNAGRICVSTQVIEAGMDLDAAALFTEAAPWPSIVQRLGRCNRRGDRNDAVVRWFAPSKPDKPHPYEADDVEAAIATLRSLEGQSVTPDGASALGPPSTPKQHAVLRRRDLLALFDTAPEISGADIDVGPYVRDTDAERNVYVAWRDLSMGMADQKSPRQHEICPSPLGKDLQEWVRANDVFRYSVVERSWERLRIDELRPGMLLLADQKSGGYHPELGWDPKSKAVVPDPAERLGDPAAVAENAVSETDEATEGESASLNQRCYVTLGRHLLDTETAAQRLCESFGLDDRSSTVIVRAARLHDIGKAHDIFQDTMRRSAKGWNGAEAHMPLAKSKNHARHRTKFFRHELASALALLREGHPLVADLPESDQFLVVYLVAAHHGRVRASLRSMPTENRETVLGIRAGDVLRGFSFDGTDVPTATLDHRPFSGVGLSATGERPWSDQAADLLETWGPFALAFLEAVVRLADWQASNRPTDEELDS